MLPQALCSTAGMMLSKRSGLPTFWKSLYSTHFLPFGQSELTSFMVPRPCQQGADSSGKWENFKTIQVDTWESKGFPQGSALVWSHPRVCS